jgi:zinc transporter ZupT
MIAYSFSLYVTNLQGPLLALAAGGFLYIALVDLLPELHKQRKPRESLTQFALLLLGIAMLWAAKFIHHDKFAGGDPLFASCLKPSGPIII